ncbi:hypothetical protein BRC86_03020 [Halobacteriales archaeon QS_3_64_16]|nr:MAG: hypothetical protein BRC86_03020 [Halobacteriales archaeon QS_3_64_16]
MVSWVGAFTRLRTAALVALAAALGISFPVGADVLGVSITPLIVFLVYSSLRSVTVGDLGVGGRSGRRSWASVSPISRSR